MPNRNYIILFAVVVGMSILFLNKESLYTSNCKAQCPTPVQFPPPVETKPVECPKCENIQPEVQECPTLVQEDEPIDEEEEAGVEGNRLPGHHKVGLLITMTGKYVRYLPELKRTFDEKFLTEESDYDSYQKHYFIFTDGEVEETEDLTVIFQKRLGWPYDSMMRFEMYYNASSKFKDMDYIFNVDADLQAVRPITPDQIIANLTGTRHPGYPSIANARSLPYDNHKESGSYIEDDESGYYFFGAFWGGKREHVLKMCKTLRRRIWADLTNEIIPAWHDESHLNRYMMDNPPNIVLPAGYVTAEGAYGGVTAMIQLNKNRQEMTDCESAQHVCKLN